MEVSIIIVNWNSREYVRKCLRSVGATFWNAPNEIIVIDAGSFDGCAQVVASEFPKVRYMQCPTNVGFAKANNEAFRASTGRFVLFLNPDIEVLDSAIQRMVELLQSIPDAGCVGSILLNADRSIQTSCVQSVPTILNQIIDAECLRQLMPKWRIWGMEALHATGEEARRVEIVSGACMLFRREVFERAGMFSEDYFMYGEDVDLCEKVLNLGLCNYLVPGARMIHHGGGSSQGAKGQFAAVMMREAIWRFLRKKRGRRYAMSYRVAMFGAALVRTTLLIVFKPALVAEGQVQKWQSAWCKWRAILGWAVLRERSVARMM